MEQARTATPCPAPDGLRVDLLSHPFGIDRCSPTFRWVMHSDKPCQVQTGYRLVLAGSAYAMAAGAYLWDTGWVSAGLNAGGWNAGVTPPGLEGVLEDDRLYHWAVATRDGDGQESPLSRPAVFSTAPGTLWEDTRGIWAAGATGGQANDVFAFLRHEFSLTEEEYAALDRAVLTATARSPEPARQYVYNLSLNGQWVGVGPARYGANPDGAPVLFHQSYDVTERLTVGDNCLSALCYTAEDKLFLCQMTLFFKDGHRRVAVNTARDADAWQALGGDPAFRPSHSIGTGYYTAHANNLDATVYPFGYDRVGFDATGWSSPFVGGDITAGMRLAPAMADPVSRYPAPKERIRLEERDGGVRIDLGAEIVGGFGLDVTVDSPATLTLAFGEELEADGRVRSAMNTGNMYRETWQLRAGENRLDTVDMMCYRYVFITGCPVPLTPSCVRGLEVRAALPMEEAAFTSDSPLLNRIYALLRHTVRVTTQDLFVDSQSRERGAYEGDLLINQLAAYLFSDAYSIPRFTAEYLYTHRTWPAEYILYAVLCARLDCLVTGDLRSACAWYDLLKGKTFTRYLNREVGLLESGNRGGAGRDAILVDWPPSERDGYDMTVVYNTVLNAVAVRSYRDLADLARWTGHPADAAAFDGLADRLRDAMITRLYDPETGRFADGLYADGTPSPHAAQHATAYALACGVYDSTSMAHRMAAFLEETGEIRMSVFGAFFLLEGLYAAGHGDGANRLLLNPDTTEGARTWAYMLDVLHATITTEAWNRHNKGNMTLSHPWGAAPAHCIGAGIFGIRPTSPGYRTFDVRFQPGGLGTASLTLPTVCGPVSASFDRTQPGVFAASVTVPCNTTATVYLPAGPSPCPAVSVISVTGEGASTHRPAATAAGDGTLALTLGSGTWDIWVE